MRWFRETRDTAPPSGLAGPGLHPCSFIRMPLREGDVEDFGILRRGISLREGPDDPRGERPVRIVQDHREMEC